jgi:hypothetical protein
MAESAAESRFGRQEARVPSGMWMLPYIHGRSSIASNAAATPRFQHLSSVMRRAVRELSARTRMARISSGLVEIFAF